MRENEGEGGRLGIDGWEFGECWGGPAGTFCWLHRPKDPSDQLSLPAYQVREYYLVVEVAMVVLCYSSHYSNYYLRMIYKSPLNTIFSSISTIEETGSHQV